MTRDQLCDTLRSRWYLTGEEIDAVLEDRDFFQPYLRNALAHRAKLGCVPESPIDATDGNAIFLLTELNDTSIIPDLVQCLRMSEDDLSLLYSDSLTEHMWLPFATLGSDYLEELWEFVTDASLYVFARHAAVEGVVAMHHFHPKQRAATVAFLGHLPSRIDAFPVDHLAGILCDCADSGLTELARRAEEFAEAMSDDENEPYPMATADDIRRAFRNGGRKDFISGRAHDVYALNKQWQRWSDEQKKDTMENGTELAVPSTGRAFFDSDLMGAPAVKIGRNDPCPCGSGKKYKKCHGS